jgi:CHAT domain-containing protein/predicted negative regulator of RcsB-dependent stress response
MQRDQPRSWMRRRIARLSPKWVLVPLVVFTACRIETPEAAYRRIWRQYTKGAFAEAAHAAGAEVTKFQESNTPRWFWTFRLLEAEALLAQAKAPDASQLLEGRIPAAIASSPLEARWLMDQSDIRAKTGHLNEALSTLENIRPQPDDPELQGRINVFRGAVLARLRRMDAAEDLLRRTADEAAARHDAYQQTSAFMNLSSCKKWENRYSDAVEFAETAVQIAERSGFRWLAALGHGNLGSLYRILGDYDRAMQQEQKAIDMLSAIGDRGNLLIHLGELGILYYVQGQFDKSIAQYDRAFNLAVQLNRNADAARNAVNIAEIFIESKQWDKAQEWNEKARSASTPENKTPPYVELNAARIAAGQGRPEQAMDVYQKLLGTAGLPPSLVWDCHALLANIYIDEKKYSQAGREFRAALDVIDKTRSDLLKSQFQITFLSSLIGFHQNYVDLLIDQHDDAGALRIIESSRARVLADRLGRDVEKAESISTPRLTQLAKETNTSLISFWIAPKRSFAWLIDKSGVQRFSLPPASEIESLVTAYNGVVEHSLQDPIAAADPNGPKLWNDLLGQIAPKISKGSRVVIIPDGPLHRLNLETLPAPTPRPHYWIEDVELAVAPSLAIAASAPVPVPQRGSSLLLIGAPDYAGTEYKPLGKAATEIRDIQTRFPGSAQTVYTGRQASPAAYRSSQPARFSLIHFAAHAEASNENPLESAVILSRQGDGYKLYARDVIDQPIDADLVTISGCRSAGVRAYAGEGLIGFAWAFLQAGARVVVAGLWDVSDSSTEPLMNEFYGGIASGKRPATAMREAKLALLELQPAYSKPYYWAPFQVYIRSIR